MKKFVLFRYEEDIDTWLVMAAFDALQEVLDYIRARKRVELLKIVTCDLQDCLSVTWQEGKIFIQ